MKWIALSILLALDSCASLFGGTSQGGTEADVAISAILDSAEMTAKAQHFDMTMGQLDPIVREDGDYHDLYPKLSAEIRFRVDRTYGAAAFALNRPAEAHRAFKLTSETPFADEESWFLRYQSAKMDDDFADVYVAIKTMRRKWPHALLQPNDRDVSDIEQGLGTLPNAEEAQLEFEEYLDTIGWDPIDPFFSKSMIRFHQAEHLYDKGDTEGAYAIASRIADADVLEVINADKRFDAMVAREPEKFDPGKAAASHVEIARKQVRDMPKWIEARSTLIIRLIEAGRFQEALDEANAAIAVGEAIPLAARRKTPNFTSDMSRAREIKGFVLFDLGQYDQALKLASAHCDVCGPNKYSVLMIAEMLVDLGRGKEALSQLALLAQEPLSFRDRAEVIGLTACAAVQVRNTALAEKSLDYLKAHQAYAPYWRLVALLCANDLDTAAQMVAEGLADPLTRPLILQPLQRLLPTKVRAPFHKELDARMERLRTRRDVLTALAPVGRINSYHAVDSGPLY